MKCSLSLTAEAEFFDETQTKVFRIFSFLLFTVRSAALR
jgi:hypothetical protein